MSHGKADLHLGHHPMMMQAPIQADLRIAARQTLEAMYEQGLLMPVAGTDASDGTVLDVYVDILGLNDRVLRKSVKER